MALYPYLAEGWEIIVPTRLGFANGNPDLIANITILKRGERELVVFWATDGQLLSARDRRLTVHR